MNLHTLDLDSIKINGYTFDGASPLEKDSDNVLVICGERYTDNKRGGGVTS
jgi:hypothetical protein